MSIKRIFRAGFIGFWRNAFVSFSAIFVMTVTLLVIGSALFLHQILQVSLQQISEKVDINVYMVPSASEESIRALKDTLTALPEVKSVKYTSREDALLEYREKNQNDELTIRALAELDTNPLGASFAIQAHDPNQYENINRFLLEQQEAEDVNTPLIDRVNFKNNQEVIARLVRIIDAVEQGTIMVLVVLVAASILISFNTIRLTIYTSREEISIMRLVGASNMFIRGPLILQGGMYGLIAGILTLLILYPMTLWIGPQSESFFGFNIFTYFIQEFPYLFMVLVGSGVLLGVLSSVFAVARHLRT